MIFLKELIKTVDFENYRRTTKKNMQNYPVCKDVELFSEGPSYHCLLQGFSDISPLQCQVAQYSVLVKRFKELFSNYSGAIAEASPFVDQWGLSLHLETFKTGWYIEYIEGPRVIISKYYIVFHSPKQIL